jgi:hypothetical protein
MGCDVRIVGEGLQADCLVGWEVGMLIESVSGEEKSVFRSSIV